MVLRLVSGVGQRAAAAGKFFNKTQGTLFYTPTSTGRRTGTSGMESKATRVTWRASERNKFNFFVDPQRDCHCPANVASGSVDAPEAFFSYRLHRRAVSGHLERAGDQQAPVRGRRGRVDGSWPIYSKKVST